MEFTLIEQGDLYAPAYRGRQSLLLAGEQIAKVGSVDPAHLHALDLSCTVLDACDCFVVPGFVDPHAHLTGAGGEEGFASYMPTILFSQIVQAGVTTIVGLLGTDTESRYLSSLHAKVRELWDEGLSAYMYTGGFELPPTTMTGSLLNDVLMIDKVIGAGEIAISDYRWMAPQLELLAHAVTETMLGGIMGGKAGVTHFHTGPGKQRLCLLHQLLDNYDIPPACLYPTHTNRNESVLDDAIALAKRGAYVDMDTVEEDLPRWLRYYREHGGPMDRLTVSSDAHTPAGSMRKLYEQFVASVRDAGLPMSEVLPLFTKNVATVLKLGQKGALEVGKDGDVLLLDKGSCEIVHLFARGRHIIKDGELIKTSKQEQQVYAGKE
jgi:beta-aspartyl-dipeptidase (metallo-type)